MSVHLLGGDPCGSILVGDHEVFASLVVAYGRFDCINTADKNPIQDNLGFTFSTVKFPANLTLSRLWDTSVAGLSYKNKIVQE